MSIVVQTTQTGGRRRRGILLAATLAIGTMPGAGAGEQLPAAAVEALERFYANFNGDQWANNEGWLESDGDPCDWHGIRCGSYAGKFGIVGIMLADNNLEGSLTGSDIFEHLIEASELQLQRNRIHGSLAELPNRLRYVNLSDNQLTGSLPAAPNAPDQRLKHLLLARNRIAGVVPPSWEGLGLAWLDLSGNRLEGSLEPAVFAGDLQCCSYVNLADNGFTGAIPSTIQNAALFDHNHNGSAGGINLCWNELDVNDPETRAWLGRHHVGGEAFESCLKRARMPIGPELSGSWFDPDRSGEGVVLQLLPGGGALQVTFGFDTQGRQHWLLGVGTESDQSLHWSSLISFRGTFGQGALLEDLPPFFLFGTGFGSDWRMDRVGPGRFHVERTYQDFGACPDSSASPCIARPLSDRLEYAQLTRLAGTTCDNRQPHQWISGAWYDPGRDGEGLVVEALGNGRGLVYWFTYRPDDSNHQAWMIGEGEFVGQTLHIDELLQPTGGRWGDEFDPTAIELNHWGTLSLEFFDPESGRVRWDAADPSFGSGEHPIAHLSAPRLATCPASPPATR